MDRSDFDQFSMALITRAEHDCAAHDPGMTEAAAMVLVGDVYALFVCDGMTLAPAPESMRAGNDELRPFIR